MAASTQNQAKSALLFRYKEVLGVELPWLEGVASAKTPKRLPVGLTRDEVRATLRHKDVQTTLIYTHALNRGTRGVVSPLDRA